MSGGHSHLFIPLGGERLVAGFAECLEKGGAAGGAGLLCHGASESKGRQFIYAMSGSVGKFVSQLFEAFRHLLIALEQILATWRQPQDARI
jgi:hypothetical protein